MTRVRTRFAPSPTGFMHIGNLRTAIFEYLLAKKYDGDFILRIEDTDQQREVEGAVDFIYNTLNLCGFTIDEGPNNEKGYGPYVQSKRLDIYKEYADKLVEMDKAYYCFCSEERLEKLREESNILKVPFMYDGHCRNVSLEEARERIANGEKYVVRQKMPKEGVTVVEDLLYGKITIDNSVLDDQILLKSDGFPTYNFANVIDDHLMEITHVVRGKEYLDQTAKYNILYDSYGFQKPTYIHVAMVLGEDGNKLSKRNGDASFMDLYHDGYLPEAMVNYLALLGWSPADNKEIFSLEELIKNFDETRISKSSSQYDVKKLQWFNHQYIVNMEDDKYLKWMMQYLDDRILNKDEDFIKTLLLIYKKQINYGKEINSLVDTFFVDQFSIGQEEKEFLDSDPVTYKVIDTFYNEVKDIDWKIENISNAINAVKEKADVKGKLLFMPIRIACSGCMHGPELAETIYLIGKDKVLERLSK